MLRKLLSLLAILGIGVGTVWAATSITNKSDIREISFKTGATYSGKNVTDKFKVMTDAISGKVKDATFEFSDGKLLVGTDPAAQQTEVLKINFVSNCSVNTKVDVAENPTLAKSEEVIKETVIALCRMNHPNLKDNELQSYTPKDKAFDGYAEAILKSTK